MKQDMQHGELGGILIFAAFAVFVFIEFLSYVI